MSADPLGALIGYLMDLLGTDSAEVLAIRIEPAAGDIHVTVLDAYRNVRETTYHYEG